jgi:hypothetical protein
MGLFNLQYVFWRMPFIPSNDIEAIDRILQTIYEEKVPYLFGEENLKEMFDESYYYDAARVWRKMKKLELITPHHKLQNLFNISDFAVEIINEHKTYSNYISSTLSQTRKKEKKIMFDRVIANGNTIAALLISSLSLVLTQCPKGSSKGQQKIEQGLESVARGLDSLKQVLHNNQVHQQKPITLDTATNE